MSSRMKHILCVLLAALMMAAMLTGCGKTEPPTVTQGGTQPSSEPSTAPGRTPPEVTAPEDEPYTEPPTEPPVQVVMPEYRLTYNGEMAEKIVYEEMTGGLRFYIKLSSGQAPLFTLRIGDAEGDFVEMKVNGAGEQIPVSFQMAAVPDNLSQEDNLDFLMAQDLVNEIVASLILK